MVNSYISDHFPIVLDFSNGVDNIKYLFKFSLVWLDEKDFLELVRDIWPSFTDVGEESHMRRLVWKLK